MNSALTRMHFIINIYSRATTLVITHTDVQCCAEIFLLQLAKNKTQ